MADIRYLVTRPELVRAVRGALGTAPRPHTAVALADAILAEIDADDPIVTVPLGDPRRDDGTCCALCGIALNGRDYLPAVSGARYCADDADCRERRTGT